MYIFTTIDDTLPLTLCEMTVKKKLEVKIYSTKQMTQIFSHILWETVKVEEKIYSGLNGWSLSPPILHCLLLPHQYKDYNKTVLNL